MQNDRRLSVWVATNFPLAEVRFTNVEQSVIVRLDLGVAPYDVASPVLGFSKSVIESLDGMRTLLPGG